VRQTALKVLRYDPATGESVVASAWGSTTDWYRNIRARPASAVRTGHSCYVPEQRLLPPAEAFAVFDDWARHQRWFAQLMLSQIGLSWEVPEAERRALVARSLFVGFRPRYDRGPAATHGRVSATSVTFAEASGAVAPPRERTPATPPPPTNA
jgi:deazaflavin-dependent oxidoreductase (nitroreductase family)